MQITNVERRKGISPVIATVILIAITLIAAIAIAGFVFGLFGSFTSVARLSVATTNVAASDISSGQFTNAATISIQNTGTANAAIDSVTIVYGGVTYTGTIASPPTVTAGSTYSLTLNLATFSPTLGTATSGETFSGSLAASNGGAISFTGTFS